jgi:hypothetical protein
MNKQTSEEVCKLFDACAISGDYLLVERDGKPEMYFKIHSSSPEKDYATPNDTRWLKYAYVYVDITRGDNDCAFTPRTDKFFWKLVKAEIAEREIMLWALGDTDGA